MGGAAVIMFVIFIVFPIFFVWLINNEMKKPKEQLERESYQRALGKQSYNNRQIEKQNREIRKNNFKKKWGLY